MKFINIILLFLVIMAALSQPAWAATDPLPVPVSDVGKLMPNHGTVSTVPAKKWGDSLLTGNGNMGAALAGSPLHDVLLADHCKLWLPIGSREIVPKAAGDLAEMRSIINTKGYRAGEQFFLQKAVESGWGKPTGDQIVWTDAFHPGFFLDIDQMENGPITEYARVEDFSTGEVWAQWHTGDGDYSRRLFVSRTDNTIVTTTVGPPGKVSLTLSMQPVASPLIDSTVSYSSGWIVVHNVYNKGKGGFDCAVRVVVAGGIQICDGKSISIHGANSVTLLSRIVAWRTPLAGTEAWLNNPNNPDFSGGHHPLKRDTIQVTGAEYSPQWMEELKSDLKSLSGDYASLFSTHRAAWSKIFDRVSIDLGGSPRERAMSSEDILARAKQDQKLSPALLERMYDAGRYVFMCSAGRQTPPNLFGIWTGTWKSTWSGDYTTDTNLELDTELAYSANLADCMDGYFYLWDSFLPDFHHNAQTLYGCRGILSGSRASNNGLDLHWSSHFPGNMWTPGTSWMAHWYYDYYQYTGDKVFLRNEAIPFMKDCALFWEDFLKGSEDASGHYTFCPSYSAENGGGNNSSQDIEIVHELLTNLIAGCEILGIEKDDVPKWKGMLAKLPPLLINDQGQLKEWSNPTQGEHNDHRHLMHLYGAFESMQFNEDDNPELWAAGRVALNNRVAASRETATHGYMHTGLAAAELGLGDLAFARIEMLAKGRSIYPSLVDAHNPGPGLLCDDGNGATPEIVDRMVVQSRVGILYLLPAMPKALPQGRLSGTRARGQISVDEIAWDMPAGICTAKLTSGIDQTLSLIMGRDLQVKSITIDGQSVPLTEKGVHKQGTQVDLLAGKPVQLSIGFRPVE